MLEGFLFFFTIISALAMIFSGAWMLLEVFVLYKTHLNQSLNMTLDIIKVVKPKKREGGQGEFNVDAERQEISKMEQFLSTISNQQVLEMSL